MAAFAAAAAAAAAFFIIAASLPTVNAVTFCPYGFSPTSGTGTASRFSVAGLFLALDRPLLCNGTLAAWQYCYRATNGSAQIMFQIWRPTGTTSFSRQHSTTLSKSFSTAPGATVCERVNASAPVSVLQNDVIGVMLPFTASSLTVGVFSPNESVTNVRYTRATSANNAQLLSRTTTSLAQLTISLSANLMVYVELLEIATSSTVSPSIVKNTASIRSPEPSLASSSSSLVTLVTHLSSSPTLYVARSNNNAQVVVAASASTIIGLFVIVGVIVVVVMAALWVIRSRKSQILHHPPTDNPIYDTVDNPKTANKYFDASNLVKQISGKSLTVSSNDQSRPNTPRRHTESRYLSLTVIASSEMPEYEKNPYRDPSDNIDEILLQLVDLNIPLLTKEDITVQSLSRSGQFSALSKAVWKDGNNRYQVAVKSATVQTQVKEHTLMLQEAAIMGQFIHPNIVSIYGVVNERHSAMLVIEHMQLGDLDAFLKTLSPEDCSKVPSPQSTSGLLLGFCQQITLAMNYLSSRDFVHCDLAARSIFVSEDNICKLGEFGMSKRLATRKGHTPVQGRDQVRWMAPETLDSNEHTSCSDVWSYGCLLYEMWSLGKMPYEDCTDVEVAEKISSGWRLPPPPGCPRHIYKMMVECWNPDPASRPNFKDILESLTQDHSQIMTIPREDARSHPKATTLGGHLQAGRGMYGDLQSSYAGGADDSGAGVNEGTYEGVGNTEPGEFYEGMDSSQYEGVYDSASVHEKDPTYDVVCDDESHRYAGRKQ